MRVRINLVGDYALGHFLGMAHGDHDDDNLYACVRLDGHGLMLRLVHPSCVTPITPQEERDHAEAARVAATVQRAKCELSDELTRRQQAGTESLTREEVGTIIAEVEARHGVKLYPATGDGN